MDGGGKSVLTLQVLLEEMIKREASDLHLTVGIPPQLRIDGVIVPTGYETLTAELCQELVYSALREDQRKRFEMTRELDLSFGIQDLSRFRVNVFLQRGVVAAAIRRIPYEVPTMESLGLPKVVSTFAELPQGLVLVTGPTGSGKSTTLAAVIDRINKTRQGHIITIEDPIEYIHQHHRCIVNQREVNADTGSFPEALKYILRQDPDIILVGEMRDLETVAAALTIAETGHLVFATLHTNSTYESINRIVDVFPTNQQRQILSQLAFVLKGVLTQQLLPKRASKGRINVSEVLTCTPAVSAVIREGKIHQIYTLMQAGQKYGMQTMNQGLFLAVMQGRIRVEDALSRSPNMQELEQLIAKSPIIPRHQANVRARAS
ncbi:MAG: type IV pilus twitching motility protein PilT [Candidatus Eisenbacteria bacterium]|uniref:Type IV pilus twitching motility protein PilT n=1 Tax=Eiseniibacteriota bacterium TaxID=2212470 RepID=A0A948RYH9_UNCEI|nr:type IV pilus twitching motility protein PilT [Candidatus Eisenbacteria bacterium]MBU1948006.1 type IV pilus twitching motility protein PilT [Candidatus Eisenbacteria bacterium]MBU2691437.1 type IV pilus twitching motility protein PilT [Candidatus Eisenbacteria bacterium]